MVYAALESACCRFPSKEYGKKFGVKIWQEYVLPDGMSSANLQEQLRSNGMGPMATEDLFLQVAALNPALGRLHFNRYTPYRRGEVLAGVASQLNLNDIQYFLDHDADISQEKKLYLKELGRRRALHVDWVVSPETLAMMATEACQRHDPKHQLMGLCHWASEAKTKMVQRLTQRSPEGPS